MLSAAVRVHVQYEANVWLCVSACLLDLACSASVTLLWLDFVVQHRDPYPNFLQLCLVCITSIYFNWPHTLHRFYTPIYRLHGPHHHMEMFISTPRSSCSSCIYHFCYQKTSFFRLLVIIQTSNINVLVSLSI